MARESFNRTWNEEPDAPDQYREPDNTVWQDGWRGGAIEDPPKAWYQNWWQRRLDVNFQQIERNGALEWLDDVPYQSNAITTAQGDMYASQSNDNTNNNPVNDTGENWLRIKLGKATESIFGFMRRATQAEVNNGSTAEAAVTPSRLRFGFSAQLSANGFIRFPAFLSGFTIQWGSVNAPANTTTTYNFPISYQNAGLRINVSKGAVLNPNNIGECGADVLNPSQFRVTVTNQNGDAQRVDYISVGY